MDDNEPHDGVPAGDAQRLEDISLLQDAFWLLDELRKKARDATLFALLRRVQAVRGSVGTKEELREVLDGFSDFDEETRKQMWFAQSEERLYESAQRQVQIAVSVAFGDGAAEDLVVGDAGSEDEEDEDEDDATGDEP